jgi:hypothetical protein
MPLKTFIANLEVRVVVDVPKDFDCDAFSQSFEILHSGKGSKMIVNANPIDDIELLDVSADEEDA